MTTAPASTLIATTSTLNYASYPHILDNVASYTDQSTAHTLRLTCHAMYNFLPIHISLDSKGNIFNPQTGRRLCAYDLQLARVVDLKYDNPNTPLSRDIGGKAIASPTLAELLDLGRLKILRARTELRHDDFTKPLVRVLQRSSPDITAVAWDTPLYIDVLKVFDKAPQTLVLHILPDPSQAAGPTVPGVSGRNLSKAIEAMVNHLASYIPETAPNGYTAPVIVGLERAERWWGSPEGNSIKNDLLNATWEAYGLPGPNGFFFDRAHTFLTVEEYIGVVGSVEYGFETGRCY